jgi:hypothetical protein
MAERLHRVKIAIPEAVVNCPVKCDKAENCYRCNDYFEKCSYYQV